MKGPAVCTATRATKLAVTAIRMAALRRKLMEVGGTNPVGSQQSAVFRPISCRASRKDTTCTAARSGVMT
ncbi:MAG: hypothetical protein MZV63_11710 [Marinilabiliales bacterium]|nr:hypothetical protein [Marinilabiliales bacterium]